jgi:hypothetical protein
VAAQRGPAPILQEILRTLMPAPIATDKPPVTTLGLS